MFKNRRKYDKTRFYDFTFLKSLNNINCIIYWIEYINNVYNNIKSKQIPINYCMIKPCSLQNTHDNITMYFGRYIF